MADITSNQCDRQDYMQLLEIYGANATLGWPYVLFYLGCVSSQCAAGQSQFYMPGVAISSSMALFRKQ